MRIPSSISPNTLKVYELPTHSIPDNKNVSLRSYDFKNWDRNKPKCLQALCIEALARNWEENPILNEIIVPVDRYHLLDILSTDLPLSLTIPIINENIYWQRCYKARWPKDLPHRVQDVEIFEIVHCNDIRKSSLVYSSKGSCSSGSSRRSTATMRKSCNIDAHKKTWKQCYIEMHIKEYLEKLKPEHYNAEELKQLSDLCASYVTLLKLDELQCSENSANRIPLNSVLTGFHNMTELSLCTKQIYIGENFTWNVTTSSRNDIKLLAKGLEKLKLLSILRIKNSDINGEKAVLILKSLLKLNMKIIEFSNCKISDLGMIAVAKLILDVPVQEILLPNNQIGSQGAEALSYAILQDSCDVKVVNLRLNNIGDHGAQHLLNSLSQRKSVMKTLIISGCGISGQSFFGDMLRKNDTLETLDISNNRIEEGSGLQIFDSLNFNTTIKQIDLRMCQITSDTELNIQNIISGNRKEGRRGQQNLLSLQETVEDIPVNTELVKMLNSIWNLSSNTLAEYDDELLDDDINYSDDEDFYEDDNHESEMDDSD